MTGGSRDAILNRLRARRIADGQSVDARLAARARNTVPARAALDAEGRIALFIDEAEKVAAPVTRLPGLEALPGAVADLLRDSNLPARLRRSPDPLLEGLTWPEALEVTAGPAGDADHVALSVATAGVAETGTLVLTSGPDNPTTLNFLPDLHLVVLPASRVTGAYEDVWDALRQRADDRFMPRVVNWITGPSRTADIEQTLLMGAHGPRSLRVFLIDGV
ncbi:MAG: lactate utilization protein [Rhodobacterales bacterium]|nr:lactate utilization protein [Rhodobacterales bacterium]